MALAQFCVLCIKFRLGESFVDFEIYLEVTRALYSQNFIKIGNFSTVQIHTNKNINNKNIYSNEHVPRSILNKMLCYIDLIFVSCSTLEGNKATLIGKTA